MDLNARPVAPDPYDLLPSFPTFHLTSQDFADGEELPASATAAGGHTSPQLSWSDFPDQTRSFVITCFDPDAPTPAGFWHWCLVNVPAETTSLASGAGSSDLEIDGPAFSCANDAGTWGYYGAAPPAGDRAHRYIFAVHALDVDALDVTDDTSATAVAFQALFHTVARATLTGTHRTVD